jgi:hypothetical protein
MSSRREAHMIEPLLALMHGSMGLDVTVQEFSAGYGVADLVGAELSDENCRYREHWGLAAPLDHLFVVEVFLAMLLEGSSSISELMKHISFAESTLKNKILPQMVSHGLVERGKNGLLSLVACPPQPTNYIVAIEAKQTRWRDAVLQVFVCCAVD